jgi:ribonuclease G
MAKELIVSVNGREKKIAIVEDDVVTEFYVERGDENQGIVGNIYKGRVMKVLPGMQSAFVDIGLERDSFLYVSDFFDEELDDEVEEERPQRPTYRDRQRQAREAAYEAVRTAQDEREAEMAVAAIRHIEELSEEPEIEPAPGDELMTGPGAILSGAGEVVARQADEEEEAVVERRDPRQRRRNRLRYTEPEPEKVVEAPVIESPEDEVAAESAELPEDAEYTDESPSRRRRRRRRRGVTGDTVIVEAIEADDEAEPVESVGETLAEIAEERPAVHRKPFVLVHHNPFERIVDDENEQSAGDLLKDAMMQERIAERIRAEEFRSSLLEVEPTPDVKVGSLASSLGRPAGFERISDDEPEAAQADAPGWKVESAAPTETETLPTKAGAVSDEQAPTAEEPDVAWPETERRVREFSPYAERRTRDLPAELGDILEEVTPAETRRSAKKEINVVELQGDVEVLPLSLSEDETVKEPLEDSSAQVRQRPRRGEMATRRGGRGRRRNFPPTRRTHATEATADTEEYEEGEQEEAAPTYMPAPAPPPTAISSRRSSGDNHSRYQRPVITDLLREGQEIIVQIAKEPIGQKGARITSHVALPGRYIVYMPTVEHIGVSRKIGTDEERQRLKRTLHQLRAEAGGTGGFIVRTAANGCTNEELRDDMNYLLRTWTEMRRRADRVKAPAIIHRDLDLVQRILRDQLSGEFTAIRVDNEEEYERMVDFVHRFAPKMVNRVKLYTKDTPILDHYGIQPEIDKAVKPRVWLKSGGYIVINQTEALVAIDVNTGKFVGKSNRLEDTIVKTNLEAAKEIVRQIRLRDLGGIIVLDFIDMEERRNRAKVLQALEYEMRNDKAPSKVLQFNDFGLVAVTRKRVKQSLERTLCTPCTYCGGGGMVKSPQTVSYEILAEARRISKEVDDSNEVILRIHPDVAKALRTSERDVLQEIEAFLGGVVSIKSDPAVHQEQFDIALA